MMLALRKLVPVVLVLTRCPWRGSLLGTCGNRFGPGRQHLSYLMDHVSPWRRSRRFGTTEVEASDELNDFM